MQLEIIKMQQFLCQRCLSSVDGTRVWCQCIWMALESGINVSGITWGQNSALTLNSSKRFLDQKTYTSQSRARIVQDSFRLAGFEMQGLRNLKQLCFKVRKNTHLPSLTNTSSTN